jgi:hypothetical protein
MTRKRARPHGHESQQRTGSAPQPSGLLISRDELKAQSKITEEELAYSLQTHLIDNADRLSGGDPRRAGASYGFHKNLVAPASLIHEIREAHGSYELAALRLLVNRTPSPSVEWIKKALTLGILRLLGPDMTVRRIRRAANNQRNSAQRISHRIGHFPVRADEARQFAGTHETGKAIEAYKRAGYNALRILYGISDPADPTPMVDVSVPTLCDTIARAPDDHVRKAFDAVRRLLIRYERELNIVLGQVPNLRRLSEAQLIELLLPFPGMFPGVKLRDALLPLFMAVFIMEPSNGDIRALALLMGMLKERDAWATELERNKEARWTIDSVPVEPDGELPAALVLHSPDERSLATQ